MRLTKKTFRKALLAASTGCAMSLASTASFAADRTVFVHLFEWKWNDIATECETFLGPKGFSAVQVSPPQEHIQGSEWWTRYQPVSYDLNSRSGNESEFQDMVRRCNAAGVEIYADAVINHMTAGGGTGSGGTQYSKYNYPMYSQQDFHNECPIEDHHYGEDHGAVRYCQLVGLADLATESGYVQDQIAGYMNKLIGYGVSGFRIDAAKHMEPGHISAIKNKLNGNPYIFQEVIYLGGNEIHTNQYTGISDVTEFQYSAKIGETFKHGSLSWLNEFGEAWGFMSSSSAVVFTDNHDNQRGHGAGGENVLTFNDGSTYDLANIFMLAWPYGYPKIMSSYQFSNGDQGPPSSSIHQGNSVNCFNEWKCEHRWKGIANMVDFRNRTIGTSVQNWWSNGGNQIAFSRGNKGFVVINKEGGTLNRSFQTGLPAGEYCDVINSDYNPATKHCDGTKVTVDGSGNASVSVPSYGAVAFYTDTACSGTCNDDSYGGNVDNGNTGNNSGNNNSGGNDNSGSNNGGNTSAPASYDQVFLRGSFNNWSTSNKMTHEGNDMWSAVVNVSSSDEFKFDVSGDWSENYGDDDGDKRGDSDGDNIRFGISGDVAVTFNGSTKAYTISAHDDSNTGNNGNTGNNDNTGNNGNTGNTGNNGNSNNDSGFTDEDEYDFDDVNEFDENGFDNDNNDSNDRDEDSDDIPTQGSAGDLTDIVSPDDLIVVYKGEMYSFDNFNAVLEALIKHFIQDPESADFFQVVGVGEDGYLLDATDAVIGIVVDVVDDVLDADSNQDAADILTQALTQAGEVFGDAVNESIQGGAAGDTSSNNNAGATTTSSGGGAMAWLIAMFIIMLIMNANRMTGVTGQRKA